MGIILQRFVDIRGLLEGDLQLNRVPYKLQNSTIRSVKISTLDLKCLFFSNTSDRIKSVTKPGNSKFKKIFGAFIHAKYLISWKKFKDLCEQFTFDKFPEKSQTSEILKNTLFT